MIRVTNDLHGMTEMTLSSVQFKYIQIEIIKMYSPPKPSSYDQFLSFSDV